jgi:holo-ACP synthase/triphosphoribosyl-dephospho-CoA synthase
LEARDQRAFLKTQIANRCLACLSLSLNVPGFPKSNSTTNAFFRSCLHDLKYTLKANCIDINADEAIEDCDMAGDIFIVPCTTVHLSLTEIKQICEDFEGSHPLGRFIDVDLNDQQGNSISSGKSKLCFFCLEKPAIECRREKTHDFDALRSFMFSEMAIYCQSQREELISNKISSLAVKAILSEISLTPKPGLVDKFNCGSHGDMNYQTFMDSTAAISPFFRELIHEGFVFSTDDLTKALPVIRNIGLHMEAAMYEATHHVNTQKGIIFLMGLSLFACGRMFSQNDHFEMEEFLAIIKSICKDLVSKELGGLTHPAKSHGENMFLKYGYTGARGEAESGFRTVFDYGLPQLIVTLDLTDEAMTKCLLALAVNNNDTNILYRSNPEVLARFKGLCDTALKNFNDANYSEVIDFCTGENISPGGSADLLAVTIFVWLMINFDQQTGLTHIF